MRYYKKSISLFRISKWIWIWIVLDFRIFFSFSWYYLYIRNQLHFLIFLQENECNPEQVVTLDLKPLGHSSSSNDGSRTVLTSYECTQTWPKASFCDTHLRSFNSMLVLICFIQFNKFTLWYVSDPNNIDIGRRQFLEKKQMQIWIHMQKNENNKKTNKQTRRNIVFISFSPRFDSTMTF